MSKTANGKAMGMWPWTHPGSKRAGGMPGAGPRTIYLRAGSINWSSVYHNRSRLEHALDATFQNKTRERRAVRSRDCPSARYAQPEARRRRRWSDGKDFWPGRGWGRGPAGTEHERIQKCIFNFSHCTTRAQATGDSQQRAIPPNAGDRRQPAAAAAGSGRTVAPVRGF